MSTLPQTPLDQTDSPSAYVSRSPRRAFERLSLTSWMTTFEALSKKRGMILPITAGTTPPSLAPHCTRLPAKSRQWTWPCSTALGVPIWPSALAFSSRHVCYTVCFPSSLQLKRLASPSEVSGLHVSPSRMPQWPTAQSLVPISSVVILKKWIAMVANTETALAHRPFNTWPLALANGTDVGGVQKSSSFCGNQIDWCFKARGSRPMGVSCQC